MGASVADRSAGWGTSSDKLHSTHQGAMVTCMCKLEWTPSACMHAQTAQPVHACGLQGGKEELVAKVLREMEQPNVVAQHYLAKPLLVHGYKFDMRIYALVGLVGQEKEDGVLGAGNGVVRKQT